VADAPVDQLVARSQELARRWVVSLLSARPLSEMSALPLDDLAREAPTLCEQVARALGSDAELEHLLASAPAHLVARADDAPAAVSDVEALRSVVWQSALAALEDPSPAQVADLADRLAFVCASLLTAALARHRPASAGGAPLAGDLAARAREGILFRSTPLSQSGRGAVLIDEHDELVSSASAERATSSDAASAPPRRHESAQTPASAAVTGSPQPARGPNTEPRARPWDIPLSGGPASEHAGSRGDTRAWPGTETQEPQMRITRGRGSPVDERA
jgi:murein DD-endopeptidase MepM/ murein hydrolase activator NlpD